MNGLEFYQFLKQHYKNLDQSINGNIQFITWLPKMDNTRNLQFKFPKKNNREYNIKAIPQKWLIEGKDAKNAGKRVNRNWFNSQFNEKNANDCRARLAIWLLDNH